MDFIKTRKIFYGLSGIIIISSLLMMVIFGFKWGIDFTGGSLWELQSSDFNNKTIEDIKNILNTQGIGQISFQTTGEQGIILRFASISEEEHQELLTALKNQIPSLEERAFNSIGPAIGKNLLQKTIWAVILVFSGILLYLIYAFRHTSFGIASYKYGILAIVALLHDITIITGFLVLMGKLAGWELNSDFIVALLVVAGYSVHDTIVVYDRIRENLKITNLKTRNITKDNLVTIINDSIHQTLVRSLNTSITTILPLIALLIVGPFSMRILVSAMMVGVTVGTYSSIFIASALLYDWRK